MDQFKNLHVLKKKNLKGKQPTELYCKSIYENEI